MSTITPPPPANPPPSSPPTSTTVTVSLPPPEFSRLPVGTKLDAMVLRASDKGEVQLQTSLGKITVQSKFPFPDNGNINLQLSSKGTLVKFLITAVNGQSPSAFTRAPAPSLPGSVQLSGLGNTAIGVQANPQQGIGSPMGATNPPSLLNIGTGLTATLIRPELNLTGASIPNITNAGTIGTSPTGIPTTNTGQTGQASNAVLPSNQTPQTGTGGPSAPNQIATIGAGGNVGGSQNPTSSNLSGTLSSGQLSSNQFSIKIIGLEPATGRALNFQTNTNLMTAPSTGKTINGTVIGSTASGQTIVSSSAGQIALSTRTALPQGTQLSLLITTQPGTATGPTSKQSSLQETSQLAKLNFEHGGRWDNLNDAFKALEQINPTLSQHLMNVLIPRPDLSLGPQLLFFLAALRGGDLKNWMGDETLRTLNRSKPELLDRLRGDFEAMSKSVEDTSPRDWRSITIPFLNDNAIDRIRFYSKSQGENDDNDEGNNNGTRFVVDLNLSQMGRLQLDGLVNDHTKRFDLFIRTDAALPVKIQNGVRTIFLNANETIGTKGGVTFQAAPAMFFEPPLKKQNLDDHIGMNV